jgi:hypothetical protein
VSVTVQEVRLAGINGIEVPTTTAGSRFRIDLIVQVDSAEQEWVDVTEFGDQVVPKLIPGSLKLNCVVVSGRDK